MAAMAGCVLAQPRSASTPIAHPAEFLTYTESLRTTDHPRFLQLLQQIHREAPPLTTREQWHLRFLDAWEAMFQGNYTKSAAELREVIDHAGDDALATKASALLLSNLGISRHYDEAFALANRLTMDLPRIVDPEIRFIVLTNLSQVMEWAGQTDLAIQYAHMMEYTVPTGETLCRPLYLQAAARFNGKRLNSASPELQRAIDACVAAGQPVVANAMRLVLGTLYLDEGKPAKTMALLDRMEASLRLTQYQFQALSAQVERAQAYSKLGRDREAKKAALAAIAMSHVGDISEWLREAYQVLYEVEKRQGHAAAALAYYEQFVAQDKGYLNDISARALAYQTVQQHVLTNKLEADALGKQNNILRLQRALDTKAVETGRLYNVLLLLTLASIVFWLFRLKRSQLRFKKLSRLDGLTGIFHHQHFISEAERSLRLLEKRLVPACLLTIDLDHFKQVNDTHGHAVGDAVLRRSVALCQQQLRPGDLFGRLGGEEFGVLLCGCSHAQGMDIAQRIRLAIADTPVRKEGAAVSISASIGLAGTDTSGYGLQKLCKEADLALYRAKRAGRNRVVADTGSSHGLATA